VIVQILIALHQAEHPLAQHVGQRVLDALGIARIGKHARHSIEQPEPPLKLPQQQQAAIA
jgi:hypothetical protein